MEHLVLIEKNETTEWVFKQSDQKVLNFLLGQSDTLEDDTPTDLQNVVNAALSQVEKEIPEASEQVSEQEVESKSELTNTKKISLDMSEIRVNNT